ncbi:hypothetical protein PSAC2689_80098 [Paraburkholderia sacchari]
MAHQRRKRTGQRHEMPRPVATHSIRAQNQSSEGCHGKCKCLEAKKEISATAVKSEAGGNKSAAKYQRLWPAGKADGCMVFASKCRFSPIYDGLSCLQTHAGIPLERKLTIPASSRHSIPPGTLFTIPSCTAGRLPNFAESAECHSNSW